MHVFHVFQQCSMPGLGGRGTFGCMHTTPVTSESFSPPKTSLSGPKNQGETWQMRETPIMTALDCLSCDMDNMSLCYHAATKHQYWALHNISILSLISDDSKGYHKGHNTRKWSLWSPRESNALQVRLKKSLNKGGIFYLLISCNGASLCLSSLFHDERSRSSLHQQSLCTAGSHHLQFWSWLTRQPPWGHSMEQQYILPNIMILSNDAFGLHNNLWCYKSVGLASLSGAWYWTHYS